MDVFSWMFELCFKTDTSFALVMTHQGVLNLKALPEYFQPTLLFDPFHHA